MTARNFLAAALVIFTLGLGGCGGGDGDDPGEDFVGGTGGSGGTGGTGTGGTAGTGGSGGSSPTVSRVVIIASSQQLPADADQVSEGIELTAFALDANSNAIPDAAMTFSSASSSATLNAAGALFPADAFTDANGSVDATLTTSGNATLRTITVTAASGAQTASIDITVVPPGSGSTTQLRMGFLSGGTLQNGVIGIGVPNLSAGGSSGLTIHIVDQSDTLFTQNVDVTLNSPCVAAGQATITPASPISTTTGAINATYTDISCGTSDTITATATANGQSLSASGTINVSAATAGSLQFVSAVPTVIGLRGGASGLPEQSTVTFRLLSSTGGPLPGRVINFSLTNTAGGIVFGNGLTTASGTTNGSGQVTAVVNSGTVLTSLRVTATFAGPPTLTTQSSTLTISTGLSDQDSFSLSHAHNIHGWDVDGTLVPVTIRASDRNNNPVPEGTPMAFSTEGGDIVSTCFTDGGPTDPVPGACTVNWESQNPRPGGPGDLFPSRCDNNPLVDTALDCEDDAETAFNSPNGALRNGRSTILVTTEGEEGFTDLNGNGTFDDGDSFGDLPEAFLDKDENGGRDAVREPFVDHGNPPNGMFDFADTDYNGQLCTHSTECSAITTVSNRALGVIIMADDQPVLRTGAGNIGNFDDTTISDGDTDEVVDFCGKNAFVGFNIVIRDLNFQPLPAGTTVAATTTLGSVEGLASQTVGDSIADTNNAAGVTLFNFTLLGPDGDDPDGGLVTIRVTSGGTLTAFSFPARYVPIGLCP